MSQLLDQTRELKILLGCCGCHGASTARNRSIRRRMFFQLEASWLSIRLFLGTVLETLSAAHSSAIIGTVGMSGPEAVNPKALKP